LFSEQELQIYDKEVVYQKVKWRYQNIDKKILDGPDELEELTIIVSVWFSYQSLVSGIQGQFVWWKWDICLEVQAKRSCLQIWWELERNYS